MNKKVILIIGLSVLASPSFIRDKYIEPEPLNMPMPLKDNDFINNKIKQLQKNKRK
jgi:hypothetical protein